MPTLTIEYRSEAEQVILVPALAFLTQMRRVADTAPAACERVALDSGHRLVCNTLAQATRVRAAALQPGGRNKWRHPSG